jgi:mRNA-degrading endonuclease RelE of RelBE toxin-antitoxin system
MSFRVEFSPASEDDLQRMRVFEQRRIAQAVQVQLTEDPDVETRNRKCLGDHLTADFVYVPPLWELRVGEFRVFYEIDAADDVVYIHAVRHKPPGKTTAEVLNASNDS